ncbi:hypothetical protein DV736_g5209, partial [Chaetothyriales sp. CBS 134916]
MKIHVVGLLVLASVSSAVPHGHYHDHQKHKNLHKARDELYTYTTVLTSTLIQTEPAAIIWVDQSGQVFSTQYYQGPTPTASITETPIVSVSVQPTSQATGPPGSSNLAPASSSGSSVAEPSATASADGQAVAVGGFWPSQPAAHNNADNQAPQAPSTVSGYGICYDMIGTGPCKDVATIDSDMALLSSSGYKLVRTYDIGCDVGLLVKSAMNHGMMAFVGINSVSNVVGDIGTLISYINTAGAWAGVHTVNIGNEVVNNGGTAAAVVAAIAVAKPLLMQAGYTGNIVTVDTYNQHLANPSLCAASSYCAVNAQPFFDAGCSSSAAGNWVTNNLNMISAKSGKDTIITEAGWPYGGSSNGAAIASPSDQTTAINGIKQAFSGQPSKVYIFQSFDALYKTPGPMGIEQYFGIFDH